MGKVIGLDRGHETPIELIYWEESPTQALEKKGIWVGSFQWFFVLYLNQEDIWKINEGLMAVLQSLPAL